MTGASIALIQNPQSELLLVKPTYQDSWSLPGGVIEANESPIEACQRECLEEIGIEINVGALLLLEYRKNSETEEESSKFIFDCGSLTSEQQDFVLQVDEIAEVTFVSKEVALTRVGDVMKRRLEAIERGIVYYEL